MLWRCTLDPSREFAELPRPSAIPFPMPIGSATRSWLRSSLADFGALGETLSGLLLWPAAAVCLPLQANDPPGGFDHAAIGGQLHGLGQASATQGGGQVSSAAQSAKFSASLCD